MSYEDCMAMPIKELFDTVFTPDLQVKPCGRDACKALIHRLEEHFETAKGYFGNEETGYLVLPDAFAASKYWVMKEEGRF